MKVLHIATIDNGGAYKAAERFHKSLIRRGIQSKILVRTCLSGDEVETYFHNPIEKLFSKGKNAVNLFFSRGEISRDILGTDISDNKEVQDADVLVLHWINSFLSVKSLERLAQTGKPIVFMMHDMWLFTGGCHVAGGCEKYKSGCGMCPLIPSAREKDISFVNFQEKRAFMEKADVVIAGPSPWIVACAGKSPVLHGKRIVCMPNAIDTRLFQPAGEQEQAILRQKYGIPGHKKIILFGAADAGTGNKYKGFVYLTDAIRELDPEQFYLVVFGNADGKLDIPEKLDRKLLGYIREERLMAEIYNLADVYVTPSLQETFGFTVCEAMACGVPVAAFRIGGIVSQITHKENGYLAEIKKAPDLAEGIRFCAENKERLSKAARKGAERFSLEAMGERYEEFLQEICGKA